MHARTVEQVRSWDSRPFDGGLAALSELSDSGHTGAVVAADSWIFMLNGRVIGVFEGSIEDAEAAGTTYVAPHDSAPLLFAMQERDGDTRAKYFTEDTPLEKADQTLTDANFTGYVELSENVLSGDYYLVYYGGTRRSVAFIGESERLETGEAAFEKAADEVGLYEVVDVSMTITEIPEPEGDPAGAAADTAEAAADAETSATADTASATDTAAPTGETAAPSQEPESESGPEEQKAGTAHASAESGDTSAEASTGSGPRETESAAETESEDPEAEGPASGREPTTAATADPSSHDPERESAQTRARGDTGATAPRAPGTTGDGTDEESESADLDQLFRAEAEWRRTRAIPALDPDQTTSYGEESGSASQSGRGRAEQSGETETGATRQSGQAGGSQSARQAGSQRSEGAKSRTGTRSSSRVAQLEEAVAERDRRIESLEEQLSEAESRNETLESELDSLREERSQLSSELETLRSERDELEARVAELEAGGSGAANSDLDPETALSGTNLFVRYRSKGEPTLDAIDEGADPAAINANLQLEHHTQFETEDLQVAGQSYRAFLEDTGAFRFVSWLLREFPAELLDTESASKLSELFEAIPEIDRVEFDGSITVDPEDGREREFAIVMRDRMGNPLAVAATNEERNPVQGEELDRLIDGAREVASSADSLAGAFYVTASFFEPAALESAESAASSGGLFSRQDKASYLKAADGSGFHLSLVEDRSETFHVTVPEL
ncbi:MAG: hypothetical protein ABEJ60_08405 [Halodesulfurarchaeum sp.]